MVGDDVVDIGDAARQAAFGGKHHAVLHLVVCIFGSDTAHDVLRPFHQLACGFAIVVQFDGAASRRGGVAFDAGKFQRFRIGDGDVGAEID